MEPKFRLDVSLDPIAQDESVHTFIPYFSKIHLNIFLPFVTESPN
jgi:hypothetical protein